MELTNTSKFQLDLERKDTFQRVLKGAVSQNSDKLGCYKKFPLN